MHERFEFVVGEQEQHRVEFDFDRTWGPTKIRVDGYTVDSRFAMFSSKLTKRFQLTVGQQERHDVIIEKTRKLFFAGFRPSVYRVFIDGELSFTHTG